MSPAKPSRSRRATPSRPPANHPAQASSAFEKAMHDLRHSQGAFPNVSARWLLGAAGIALLAAIGCAWLTLCLLYWQGSWQLLYHPKAAITQTPANVGLTFDSVHFAATETGVTQLTGWWLPNPNSRFTILYLHGPDGNLSETVDVLASLHRENMAVFAIDYRGYGQSQPSQPHPSEKQFRQDAEWALTWLTLTRNIPAKSIVLYGSNLGANLTAELAADHNELAGVILDQPSADATEPIFHDPRSRFVPARSLFSDRYDLLGPAAHLQIRSLWILPQTEASSHRSRNSPAADAYTKVPGQKMAAWLTQPTVADPHFPEALERWLDDLENPVSPIPDTNQLTR
jgi:uncharacterized protein